ncbi:MAG: hypothetical protein CMA60_05720 [Euryarchaeota archaeon]|nr:hypothetical protein [Euryarchaeota archaeon]|tara:strand:+ start:23624 stop:23962 length:339 start_codon:yes stop_codon:yes gene_type:complete
MGREIVNVIVSKEKTEWWIVSTTCEYGSRVSKPFKSLDELFGALEQGGLNKSIIAKLKVQHYIPTMEVNATKGFVFSYARAVDEALHRAGASCPDGSVSLHEDYDTVFLDDD